MKSITSNISTIYRHSTTVLITTHYLVFCFLFLFIICLPYCLEISPTALPSSYLSFTKRMQLKWFNSLSLSLHWYLVHTCFVISKFQGPPFFWWLILSFIMNINYYIYNIPNHTIYIWFKNITCVQAKEWWHKWLVCLCWLWSKNHE